MTPEDEQARADALESEAYGIELAALLVVARRLKGVTPDTTYAQARAWESADMARVSRILARGGRAIMRESDEWLGTVAADADEWAEPYFEARGMSVSVAEDAALSHPIQAAAASSRRAVRELCRTSVLSLVAPDGTERRMAEAYRQTVDQAINAARRSEADYVRAVRSAARDLGRYGLRVRYESGATRELYAAVQMSVRDGFGRATQEIRGAQAERFGADGVEVSAHGLCAADHLPYQGRRFPKAEFEAVQASLGRPIAQGLNCRHMVAGIILGVSAPAYTDGQLAEYARRSAGGTGFSVNGRELSGYEFTQWQRRQELAVRKLRAQARLADAAGLDGTDLRRQAAARARAYRKASARVGIGTREERMRL